MRKSKWRKTQVVEAYSGRSDNKLIRLGLDGDVYTTWAYRKRGKREDWSEKNWPPKRVRITVEVEE